MSPLPPDPYKTLGVDRNADISVIKTAYRKLVLKCHPDKVQDPALKAAKQDEFQRVQQAYEILGDEKKRREYDESANLRKLRDELSRGMGRAPSHRPTSNAYKDANVYNAEPRSPYKPGPPPTSPFSHYSNSAHQFTHTAEFAFRTKVYAGPSPRSSGRASSSDKAREDAKEDRRRRKDDDDYYDMSRERERDRDRERERERDRERDREAERERQRERERRPRADRERDDKKERSRRDNEKRDKERDRARRQDQQDKFRTKKAVYVEDYSGLDGGQGQHMPKKKTSGGIGTATGANTSSKRHTDSPRRDRSAPREDSPRPEIQKLRAAVDYINYTKAPQASAIPEGVPLPRSFPDDHWHAGGDFARPRRPSQDDKKMRSQADTEGLSGEAARGFAPARLKKAYTSPPGAMHMSASSAPSAPGLSRAASDMDYYFYPPPEVPTVPVAGPSRHSRMSDRRRRDPYNTFEADDMHTPHMPSSRGSKPSQYRADYFSPMGSDSFGKPVFDKVKESPRFSRDQVYERKPISVEDVHYSTVPHSYVPASS